MNEVGRYLFGVVGGLLLATGTAEADRTMVVVLDASGSMQILRSSDSQPRFDAAKTLAADRIMTAAMEAEGLAGGVAVYTFSDTGITAQTAGFVSAFTAATVVSGLTVTSDLTPLASSLCDTIDIASASGTGSTTARLLEVYSDGGENNTNPLHACYGTPAAAGDSAPFAAGTWQNKVYLRATNASPAVTINATLFTNVSAAFAKTFTATQVDPETAMLQKFGKTTSSVVAFTGPLSDADFYAALAAATNGDYTEVGDSSPLPVYADVDGDFDVDRDDAIALARRFGAPPISTFDLDANGSIGYTDYVLLLTRLGTGTGTPAPDPYTAAGTVSCGNNDTVVIDGKVIESAGTVIYASNECNVVIRNSLLVSGGAAIVVRGNARVTVENSIVVGETTWLRVTGAAMVTGTGSVFHGKQVTTGTVQFTDGGGNTFE